jgi:hypothetical protein
MEKQDFVTVNEVYIKTDRVQGNMVILKESEEASFYFLMFVGDAELTAIAKEKGFVESKRPLTHELYLAVLNQAGVTFDRVEIHDMTDNTFFAKVYVHVGDEIAAFDSRPSDAVALALHEKCSIMVHKKLLRRELTPEEVKEYEEIVKTVKF